MKFLPIRGPTKKAKCTFLWSLLHFNSTCAWAYLRRIQELMKYLKYTDSQRFFLSAVKTFTAWYLKAILSSITAAKSKYHENAPKLLAGERWTKIPTACLRFPTVCKRAKFRLKVASRGLRCVNHKGYSTERETDLRTAKLETLTTP